MEDPCPECGWVEVSGALSRGSMAGKAAGHAKFHREWARRKKEVGSDE